VDHGGVVQQLRQFGAPESVCQAWESTNEGDALEVLECNWRALQTYQRCRWNVVAGMAGVHYDGIAAHELRAALALCRVPAGDWDDVLWRVDYLVREAQTILNARSG
jgi:hypothetical protein